MIKRSIVIMLLVILVATSGAIPRGAAAQSDAFGCDDILTQESAQALLEVDPSDPFGLDSDQNGIACDEASATSNHESEGARDAVAADEERLPLDARLGGTIESWEAEFGSPMEAEGMFADLGTEYEIPEYSSVYADEQLGRVHSISLFAPRPAGEEWSNTAHEMNWSVGEAHDVALRFLPRDVRLDEPIDSGSDFVQITCSSSALANEVPAELYDYVDDTSQRGQCSYVLFYGGLGRKDQISWIWIALEVEEPLDGNGEEVPISVELPQSEGVDTQGEITAEEQAYLIRFLGTTESMFESMDRFNLLWDQPLIGDPVWTSSLATETAIWQAMYDEALALSPPPALADMHAEMLEVLRLLSEAGRDLVIAFDVPHPDNVDIALGNEALNTMAESGARLVQVMALADAYLRERQR